MYVSTALCLRWSRPGLLSWALPVTAEGCLPPQQLVRPDHTLGMMRGGTLGGLVPAAVIHSGMNKTGSRLPRGVFVGAAEEAREKSARIARGLHSNPTWKRPLHTSTEWASLLPAPLETEGQRFHPPLSVFVRRPCRGGVPSARHCTLLKGIWRSKLPSLAAFKVVDSTHTTELRGVVGGTLPRWWTPMVVGH